MEEAVINSLFDRRVRLHPKVYFWLQRGGVVQRSIFKTIFTGLYSDGHTFATYTKKRPNRCKI